MKTIKNTWWILILFFPFISFSQGLDSLKAQAVLDQAEDFLKQGGYEKATSLFQRAKDYYEGTGAWDKHVESINGLAKTKLVERDMDSARILVEEALEKAEENLPLNHLQFADSYAILGKISTSIGGTLEAKGHYEKAIEIKINHLGTSHLDVGLLYKDFGVVHAQLWSFEEALDVWNKSLEIIQSNDPKSDGIGELYSYIAYAHAGLLDFSKGLDFSYRSIAAVEKSQGKNSPRLMSVYNVHGIILRALRKHKEAVIFYKKALKLARIIHGDNDTFVANYQNNIGNAYEHTKNYDLALKFYQEALKTYELAGAVETSFYALTLKNIGNIHLAKNAIDIAVTYFEKSAEITRQMRGPRHSTTALAIKSLSIALQKQGRNKEAINGFQRALMANSLTFDQADPSFNPKSDDFLDLTQQIEILLGKGQSLHSMHREESSINHLLNALNTYMTCDSVIDLNRKTRTRYEDKIHYGDMTSNLYNDAVLLCHDFFNTTGDKKYVEQALYFAEKNQSAALLDKVAGSEAKKFSGVPDGLLALEKELKSKKSDLTSNIKDALSQKDGYDTTFVGKEQSSLGLINDRLDSLEKVFKNKYLKYSELYKSKVKTVQEIQQATETNRAFIEYVAYEDSLSAILLTKETLDIVSLKADSLDQEVQELLTSLSSYPADSQTERLVGFRKTSYALYKKLIEPVLQIMPKSIDHLTLVTTPQLANLPFDLLIQEDGGNQLANDFKSLNYLMQDFKLSYANSINSTFHYSSSKKAEAGSLFAFAPTYKEATESNYPALRSGFRNALTPLVWNTKEVDAIDNFFEGEIKKGESATEASFKAEVENYQIIHLAMHAFVDHEEPMGSKLVFSLANDSIDDGMLHAYELFNMDFAAEMVVLSACNTGIGKYQDGEGIMSLGKAFAYAGCPSVVTSHWSVDDEATSVLMTSFYQYISEGFAKDEALNQAKMDFLQNSHGLKTHPFFWGGFVVIGNTDPLSSGFEDNLLLYLGAVTLGLLIIVFIRRKMKSSKS